MFLFVLGLVLIVFGTLGLVAVRIPHGEPGRRTTSRLPLPVVVIPALLGVLCLLSSVITTVGTKDVGVVTTFGKPTGRDLENGLHLKAPWQKVTELDGAINPDDYSGHNCINVRIGDSSTACVSATIRWRIVPEQASVLFQDYRSNDVNATVRTSLVKTQFNAALNDVLGKFNPLQSVAAAAQAGKTGQAAANSVNNTAPNLDAFSTKVADSMKAHLAAAGRGGQPQVQVVSVTISFILLAATTQDKVNDYLKEVGATRVAEQREQTTAAQARANQNLAKSVSKDPNVLVSKCFDTVEEAVKAKYALPAGFSCWNGGGSAVVVPSR